MTTYTPHTDAEVESMLDFIGVSTIDELFSMVPEALRLAGGLDVADGVSEFDAIDRMQQLASMNRSDLVCFAGGGAYDHDIPSAVRRLAGRTEFVTSYTPYQPEVAQGVLQALFEYQTMVSRLSGLPIANASLYDGATACVEALNLSVAATSNQRVLMSAGVHPNWQSTMRTMAAGTGHDIADVPTVDGVTDWSSCDDTASAGAVVVQYPNYFGVLEDVRVARTVADRLGARLIVAFDPVAVGLLRSPGELGADVAVGEGQPFGTPMSLGGPYVGLFACRTDDVRRLPGRLVGETVDVMGTRAYVTTLRAREQDIRREKASSNVCTNQTLIAATAAIQLAWLGTDGLRELALRCARATRFTRDLVTAIPGVELLTNAPTLREFPVRLPIDVDVFIARMIEEGFLPGVALEGNGLLIAATERRTRAQVEAYADAFEQALR
jgi:glycine dehydrogenase subunit 1